MEPETVCVNTVDGNSSLIAGKSVDESKDFLAEPCDTPFSVTPDGVISKADGTSSVFFFGQPPNRSSQSIPRPHRREHAVASLTITREHFEQGQRCLLGVCEHLRDFSANGNSPLSSVSQEGVNRTV